MPFDASHIIFEDNHLIIVNKKAGEIVQGDKTGDVPLLEDIKNYLKIRYNKPGDVFLGCVHRIDRPVSGIVVFAKTSKALTRINKLFHDRAVEKKYWAVVKNKPAEPKAVLTHFLIKDNYKNISKAYNTERANTHKAILDYTLIQESESFYLLEINLHTGRHHQIRAQLAAIGCPIKGDVKYGYKRTNENASISLHAVYIKFAHPVGKNIMELKAPLPKDKTWQIFDT